MNQLTPIQQMQKLLLHWNDHLQSHVAELAHWRQQSTKDLDDMALHHLVEAEMKMQQACDALSSAYEVIGDEKQQGEET
ncbi:MAG: hypothetical protein G8D61_16630 [gamma proteobacterium symbiont of Ctena orbiculata]